MSKMMRQLHPATVHETFVASGSYHFEPGSVAQGATESWTVHLQPDGSRFIRLDYDASHYHGFSVLSEILVSPSPYRVERIDIQAFSPNSAIKQIKATYTFYDDHVEIGRTLYHEPRTYEELALASDYIVAPFSVYGVGLATAAMSTSPDKIYTVVTPGISFDDEHAFLLTTHTVQLRLVHAEAVIVMGHPIESTLYRWGYEHDPACQTHPYHAEVWLDRHHTPLRHHTRNNHTHNDARLTRYAHRRESVPTQQDDYA